MSVAGVGAEDQARRHGDRVEQLKAELARAEAAQRAWSAGARGERLVADVLTGIEGSGWWVLHDVHWPGRPKANIDHIAIGPTGLWVIDAKNWTGTVTVRDGVLRQNGYRRDRETTAARDAADAVAALLEPRHRLLVHPVICLAGEGSDQLATRTQGGTTVVGCGHLLQTLLPAAALPVGGAAVLAEDASAIADHLRALLSGPTSPAVLTTRDAAAALAGPRHPDVHPTAPRRRTASPRAAARTSAPRPSPRSRSRGRGRTPASLVLGRLVVALTILWIAAHVLPALAQPPAVGHTVQHVVPTSPAAPTR